eukprot:TRINITY_DN8442_c0_g1_i2.p2 TRINITY_DN8442_c0_g1~~TRINITY_DN8442_c0_g1_i2.p2  ORF type:complete len:447 (+),score=129.64 TRINITY_DN8442_c0_g1_i2:30-1370(+)
MSDEEDFMIDSGDDEEDNFDFEYESDEGESDGDADLENVYYGAKQYRQSDPDKALAEFQKVIDDEPEKAEWGFKAHKQKLKLLFKNKRYEEMFPVYESLLTYIRSAVTRNYSEKSLNSILDYISTAEEPNLLQRFYEATMVALKEAKNERLWFKTNLKLGKVHLDRCDWTRLSAIIAQLHESCRTEAGEDDQKKGTQLLEIYALEIQMYTERKDLKKLKSRYERSLKIKSAIPHPFTMGVIRECGGKMHLREEQWQDAYQDFFEAFKNYDESGSAKKVTCLKYLVLANMLMQSEVDPFEAQESKPYKNDSQITAMTDLVGAYQANDIKRFQKVLARNQTSIMSDPFIREYIQDLLNNIRTQILVQMLKPYTRVRLAYLADRLNIEQDEVESLLIKCILNKQIHGRLDQIQGLVVLEQAQDMQRFDSLKQWTAQLDILQKHINQKIS